MNFTADAYTNQRSFEKNRGTYPESLPCHFNLSITAIEKSPSVKFGSTPHWCSKSYSLIYVDVFGRQVIQFSSRLFHKMSFESDVAFAIPSSDTTERELILIVGLEDKILEVNFTKQIILRELATLPFDLASNGRFVHAKCSPNGTLYIGCVCKSWIWGPMGYLLRLCPNNFGETFTLHRIFQRDWLESSFQIPNASAWYGDEELLVMDAGVGKISSFKVAGDAESSHRISNGNPLDYLWEAGPIIERNNTIFTLASLSGMSGDKLEGIAVDSSKNLWVTTSGSKGHILQINPETGDMMQTLAFPISTPTACIFG